MAGGMSDLDTRYEFAAVVVSSDTMTMRADQTWT